MIDPATIDKMKAENGAVFLLEHGDDQYLVRRPTRMEYEAFIKTAMDEELRHTAQLKLVRAVMLVPDLPAFDKLLEQFPALADSLSGPVLKLAGAAKLADAKKL